MAHGISQPEFRKLFRGLRPLRTTDRQLTELGGAGKVMDSDSGAGGDSTTVPAGYTYLGQFIDHDITLEPLSQLGRRADISELDNLRTPALELDSVYGAGPGGQPYLYDDDGLKLRLGSRTNPDGDLFRPGTHIEANPMKTAIIGDPRNDENLIVAQMHLAFIKFHNAVIDHLASETDEEELFEEAQQTVRFHYQWVVLHDFLPKIVGKSMVDKVLKHGRRFYRPRSAFIPLEFAGAAYRFGHSMVRDQYNFNATFPNASFAQLFAFTGGGASGPPPTSWIIDWSRFFPIGKSKPQMSRRIDTQIAKELHKLPFIPPGEEASLPARNLLRGKTYGLPSGQLLARRMGVKPLTPAQLSENGSGEKLRELRLLRRTPLFYYLLKEAEVLENGEHLGPVGGRLVAETLIGLLELDGDSFLSADPDWKPTLPSAKSGQFTMSDLLKFAGVA